MKIVFNENFTYIEKDGKFSLTSILPDSNSIFHFSGLSVSILKLMIENKSDINKEYYEKKLNISISDADWSGLVEYLLEKNILKNV